MTALIRPASFRTAETDRAGTPPDGTQIDPMDLIFLRLKQQQEAESEAQDREAERLAALIGDNGGPALVQPFGIDAPWFQFADAAQIAHLAKLHVRIERRKLILADDYEERRKIRACCVRRMRRAAGKN